ncbi:hypothetical protein [Marinococcus sp. PL1-022]|uniref:hypothetical protein n=1 Tax=Marinococcus sp. PL1-022 TaxID=3095363 RepID=UPI0029C3CA18|nr:hypothetical protein [Marinococcus sp. PL1-022]MDX6152816.1 hypothetical protein [Marinococcus sp. PL1-022]
MNEGLNSDLVRFALGVSSENNRYYEEIINNSKIRRTSKEGFYLKNLSIEQKLQYAEIIFYDCLQEIVISIDYANHALETSNFGVAFSLVRKPFRDLLACMEYLTFDWQGYIEGILDNDIERIDVSMKNNKDKIEKNMVFLMQENESFFKGMKVEDLKAINLHRYGPDKAKNTLSTALSQSLHLVTNNPAYKTPKNRLNFIPLVSNQVFEQNYLVIYLGFLPMFYAYLNRLVAFNTLMTFNHNNESTVRQVIKYPKIENKFLEFTTEIENAFLK